MPQYREALELLRDLLEFQAALMEKAEICFRVEPAVARERWRAGRPLFAGAPLPLPSSWFLESLADLRALLPPEGMTREALDRLLASDAVAPSNVDALLDELLSEGDACIRRLAAATSADPDALAFLLNAVLSPFFERQAVPYREWVKTAAWRRGICPMCGAEPWMARLARENGQRILACSLCHTEWPFSRLACPFCGGDEPGPARYFQLDTDLTHRVYCCQACGRYIKTVDERALGGSAVLPVEDVVTAHLEALARAEGYR